MNELPIVAKVCVVGGPEYDVKLKAIPAREEFISIFSHLEQASGQTAKKSFVVVEVQHHIVDYTPDVSPSGPPKHEIIIFVKPTTEARVL